MNRSARSLGRSIVMLVMLLTLTGTLAQPAAMSRAQGSTPPPPTPTAVSVDPAQDDSLSSQPGIVIVNPDGTYSFQPTETKPQVDVPAHESLPASEVPSSSEPVAESQAQVAPQAVTASPLLVNIVSSPTVRADQDLTYTIYFTNTSTTQTFNNVLLQNGIGAGQRYTGCDSSNVASCSFVYTGNLAQAPTIDPTRSNGNGNDSNARQIVWLLGNIGPNQKGNIKYTVHVPWDLYPKTRQAAVVLGNTVGIYQNDITSNNLLNQDEWGVTVVGPVLSISKTATPASVLQGDQITFEITVGNGIGSDATRADVIDATQLVVLDIVPEQLTNIQPQNGGVYNPSNRWLTWNFPSLKKGDANKVTVRFTATVRSDLTGSLCDNIRNRGNATSAEFPLDHNGQKVYINGDTETVTNLVAPAGITASVVPNRVKVGENATWTVTVSNYWKTAINGATITFHLANSIPQNVPFTYVSSSPQGQFDGNNNILTWTNVNIPAKQDFTKPGTTQLTITAKASRFLDGHKGVAFITGLPNGIPTGCLRNTEAPISVDPLLSVVKTVTPTAAVLALTDVTYTIDVYNVGNQVMNDVSLVDELPNIEGKPFVFKAMVSGPSNPPTAPTISGPNDRGRYELRWNNIVVPAAAGANPGKTTLKFTVTANGKPPSCADNRVIPDSSISQARDINSAPVCIAFPWGVSKTANRTGIAPRDTNRRVEFTVTFKNYLNAPQDFIPADFMASDNPKYYFRFGQMISGGPPPVSTTPDSAGLIYWPKATLGAKGTSTDTLTYKYSVDMPFGDDGLIYTGNYCNKGILLPEPYAPWGYGVYNEVCIVVSSVELRANKLVDRNNVGLGEVVTYSILLDNKSTTDDVQGVTISDTLPINMSYVGPGTGAPAPTVTVLANGQQRLNWTGLLVTKNSQRFIAFKARAPGLINRYWNIAGVGGGQPAPSLICENAPQGYSGCHTSVAIDVSNKIAIKPEVSPSISNPSGIVTYTLTLVNNNNIPYQKTIVTDTLPVGFTFVKMISGAAPFQPRSGVLVWGNQTVPQQDGPEGKLTFIFQAKGPQGYGAFTSRIEASSVTGIIPPADNVARVLIAPKTPALSLVAPALVNVGSEVKFKISLVNPDTTPVTNVVVNNMLPAGFTFKQVETGVLTPTISAQKLTWNNLTMPAASNGEPGIVDLTFYATAPMTVGEYTNTVTATGSRTIDQTYNTAKIVVAKLKYIYLAIIRTT